MATLEGRGVLVTGAASGIGRATARLAASRGAAVAVLDRDADGLAATVEAVTAAGGRAHPHVVDVTDDAAVRAAVEGSRAALGRLDGVVAAAGIFAGPDLAPAHEVSVDAFRGVLEVNLVGTFSVVHHALAHLVEQRGAIVTIASTAAIRGHGFGPGYTASKGGVDALTRLLAVQYGASGVRANCVCPGGTDTPMTGGVFATPEAQERARRLVPLQRYAQPEEIASVVGFLLSDDAAYLTGQTLTVDGGATIT